MVSLTSATATVTSMVSARPSARIRVLGERCAAGIIVTALVTWLVVNAIHAPAQFVSVVMQGLNNGALYALIALGYTLVYGIIGLINFAHGDLFMLGTVFSGYTLTAVVGENSPGRCGGSGSLSSSWRSWGSAERSTS